MRNMFRAYYSPSPAETDSLWSDGLLILDTNALLNLFRYSPGAREDFFKALTAKRDSLWIPHQVGKEFHKNRISIINQQTKAFGDIEKALGKARADADTTLNNFKRHPSLNITPLRETFTEAIHGLITEVQAARDRHRDGMLATNANDNILEQITELYDERVGSPFDGETLAALYKEGANRYEKKIPPGFKDAVKDGLEKYGDLVLWKQILVHAEKEKKPAIFVTDDQKEDWWHTVDSNRHGARPELVEEYYSASEQRIQFMTTDRFLDFAKGRIQDIRSESITELQALTRDQARRDSATDDASINAQVRTTMGRVVLSAPRLQSHAAERMRRLDEYPQFRAAQSELEHARTLGARAEDDLNHVYEQRSLHGNTNEITEEIERLEQELRICEVRERLAQSNLSDVLRDFDREELEIVGIPFGSRWHGVVSRAASSGEPVAPSTETRSDESGEFKLFSDLATD